jgi:hypothetical protein
LQNVNTLTMEKVHFNWKGYCFGVLVCCFFIYCFNYIIDPLGYNYSFEISAINKIKPVAPGFARQLKPYIIEKVKPSTLILGSSRAAYAADPSKIRGFSQPVYNAAIQFGQPFEMLKILEHAVKVTNVKEVILFLEYNSFANEKGVQEFSLSTEDTNIFNLVERNILAYFSVNSFLGSFETIMRNIIGKHLSGTTSSGFIKNTSQKRFGDLDPDFRKETVKQEATVEIDYHVGLNIVREIKNVCKSNKIKLYVILGPFPLEHIKMRKRLNSWPKIVKWKKDLTKIVTFFDYFDEKNIFDNTYFYDRVHFTSRAAEIMINSIKDPTYFVTFQAKN